VASPASIVHLVAIALAAHALSAASLGALGFAFGHPLPLRGLVAAYALGLVTWIFSPVPQGIGVVEGVIAATTASLGVPLRAAILMALAFRALTFWLPMLAGFVLVRRLKALRAD
jgi:hypothetical protein